MADIDQKLYEYVDKITKELEYTDFDVKIEPVSTHGANLTTKLYKISIKSSGKEDLNLFAKMALMSDDMRASQADRLYKVEYIFYDSIVKVYKKLQEDRIECDDHKIVWPQMYAMNKMAKEETVVLEDLSAKGFSCLDRLEPAGWNYAEKAVRELARFHALSIAFEEENGEEFQKIADQMPFMMLNTLEMAEHYFKPCIERGLAVIEEKYKERFQKFFDEKNRLQEWIDIVQPRSRAVIAHGDYRVSNIMHRLNEGKLDLIAVDYQTLFASNPCTDLMYFLYTSTDKEFRDKHLVELKEAYHKELTAAVKRLGLDDVYTKEQFEDDWKSCANYALILSIIVLPVIFTDPDNAMALDVAPQNFTVTTSKEYTRRLNEILDEFACAGLI